MGFSNFRDKIYKGFPITSTSNSNRTMTRSDLNNFPREINSAINQGWSDINRLAGYPCWNDIADSLLLVPNQIGSQLNQLGTDLRVVPSHLSSQLNQLGDSPIVQNIRDVTLSFPRCNMVEAPDAYIYNIDVPGVKKEDIRIVEKDGVITVTGTRHHHVSEDNEGYAFRETRFGKFSRSFKLPSNAVPQETGARLDDGVLKVRIPKMQGLTEDPENSRQINIQ